MSSLNPSPAAASNPVRSIADVAELEEMLSAPTARLVEAFETLEGDLIILGAAGKMGPTLARMARRAVELSGRKRRVIGVSRFSNRQEQQKLQACGVETIQADLLQPEQLEALPTCANVIYMAGMKFGAAGNAPLTWAMNAYLPALVCNRFAKSRIVAFSTGNIYGLSPVVRGGSVESDAPAPVGDYAMSCLGRERMFEYFSNTQGTAVTLLRLNYAVEMRYGVIVDLARKVWEGQSISLEMAAFNAIWQGDANAMALLSLGQAGSPATVLNLAGPELLSVRRVCEQLGQLMQKPVRFCGEERSDALLSNGQVCHRLLGYPQVSAGQMIQWVADWTARGGELLGKPTHFETRDGTY